MTKLSRWTIGAVLAGLATAAPANASFLQELGSPFAAGDAPYGVSVADFNRDGRPDIAAMNGTSSTMSVFLRQPGVGFLAEKGSPFAVTGGPSYGSVADFDGSGWPGIAIAGYDGAGGVSILRRLPTGGFENFPGSPFPIPKAGAVATADFNGDGYQDVAAAKYNAGGLSILLRQGSTFVVEPGTSPVTGANPRYLAVADFNSDGRPDLAVSNLGANSVTVLLRKASGGFDQEAGSPIAVGKSPIALVATDLTGDSRPDIAVVNSGSNSVSLLKRVAAGGFEVATPIPVGVQPEGLAAADFNKDGRMDLAAPNHGANNVSIMLRQADGSYAPEAGSPIPTGVGPNQVASADFNGDGKADLAVSNDQAASVSVLLNTTPDPVVNTPPAPVVTPAAPAPVVQNPPPPAPRINGRLVLAWTIFKGYVRLDGATLKDVPAGSTVKISCSSCKTKAVTLTTKKSTLPLTKLRNAKLKRGKSFSVTITKPGYVGQVLSRKVKNYGKTLKARKKALKAPFSESRACVPVNASKPAKTC